MIDNNNLKNPSLIFQIDNDQIIVRSFSYDSESGEMTEKVIDTLVTDTSYRKDIISNISTSLKLPEMKKHYTLMEKMLNYDLDKCSLYFRIIGYRNSLDTKVNYYDYYRDGKLDVEITGELIKSGKMDLNSAVILVSEVFGLYGVVDYLGWGTWIKFLISPEINADNITLMSGIMTTPSGVKDITLKIGDVNTFELHEGGTLDFTVIDGVVLYGTLATKFLIESLSGVVVVDARKDILNIEIDEDSIRALEHLQISLGSRPFYSGFKLSTPKLQKIQEYEFTKYIGKAKLQKNLGDRIAPNDILAILEDASVKEQFDIKSFAGSENLSELNKVMKAISGEFVQPGSVIAQKRSVVGIGDSEIISKTSGIVDVSELQQSGIVKIVGAKSVQKIECGMMGVLKSITPDGYVKIVDEAYSFQSRFHNLKSESPKFSKFVYINSTRNLNSSNLVPGAWVGLDIDFSEVEFQKVLEFLYSKNISGIVINQIPVDFVDYVSDYNLELITVNGFGKERLGIRYDIAFSRSNVISIEGNQVVLGI